MQSFFTAKNTTISLNLLVWKFCGNAQFPPFHKIYAFPQNFHNSKLREITVFFAVFGKMLKIQRRKKIKKGK